MLSLGPLAFAAPWALAAAGLLPVLWWLLRVVPPAPRRLDFPAIRLLFGLEGHEDASARTPWWVLALRLLLALLVILTAAHPLLNPGQPLGGQGGPLVLAVDDGWASARDWPARRAFLDQTLARAERDGRPVVVVPTAPPADGGKVEASPMMAAAQARPLVAALAPKPWTPDRAAAAQAVKGIARDRVAGVVWLADGIDDGHGADLAHALQTLGGGVEMVTGDSGRLLLPPRRTPPATGWTSPCCGRRRPARRIGWRCGRWTAPAGCWGART
ncbi:MAG: BatA domain-containing protein [Magnetospirillum sp.]|nr:BatA domain-containing protein [Magnetospirillum sp.]